MNDAATTVRMARERRRAMTIGELVLGTKVTVELALHLTKALPTDAVGVVAPLRCQICHRLFDDRSVRLAIIAFLAVGRGGTELLICQACDGGTPEEIAQRVQLSLQRPAAPGDGVPDLEEDGERRRWEGP